jgi:hypothetical protein
VDVYQRERTISGSRTRENRAGTENRHINTLVGERYEPDEIETLKEVARGVAVALRGLGLDAARGDSKLSANGESPPLTLPRGTP